MIRVIDCAGLYIPMLVDRILNNSAEAVSNGVNMEGFMIGNGCPGWDVLTCTPYSCGHTGGICAGGGTEVAVDFRFGHGFGSQPTYASYVAACGDQRWDDPSPACIAAINAFTDETGTGGLAGSTYNIYDMCGNDDTSSQAAAPRPDGAVGIYAKLNDGLSRQSPSNTAPGLRDYAGGTFQRASAQLHFARDHLFYPRTCVFVRERKCLSTLLVVWETA